MRRAGRWACVLALAGLAGCRAAMRDVSPIIGPPEIPPDAPVAIPADANFVLTVSEAVADAEADVAAYTKIFIDGKEAGRTAIAPKSKERSWGQALPAGNHLFRFEHWLLPIPGEWTPLDARWQPPERFMRVEASARTVAVLKFFDGGRRQSLQVLREPR